MSPRRFRVGWLCRTVGEMPLDRVETTLLVEPLLGQVFGYGTVVVIGISGTRLTLACLPKPHSFHLKLQEALEAVREGRPLAAIREAAPEVWKPAGRPAASRFASLLELRAQKPSAPKPELAKEPERTPLERAWAELNRPLPESPLDNSRFMPKG